MPDSPALVKECWRASGRNAPRAFLNHAGGMVYPKLDKTGSGIPPSARAATLWCAAPWTPEQVRGDAGSQRSSDGWLGGRHQRIVLLARTLVRRPRHDAVGIVC